MQKLGTETEKNPMLTSKLVLIPYSTLPQKSSHISDSYCSKIECLFKSIGRQEKCSHSVQGKEQRLCFAGAAVKSYPMSKVRETQVRW